MYQALFSRCVLYLDGWTPERSLFRYAWQSGLVHLLGRFSSSRGVSRNVPQMKAWDVQFARQVRSMDVIRWWNELNHDELWRGTIYRYFLIFSLMFAEIKHVYPDAPGMHRNQMFVRSNIQYIHFCLRIGSRYRTGWWFQTCFIFRPIIDDYLVGGLEHFLNE